jgi:alkylation response protein AidB-like acyl-CoA dehydrogenase
LDFAWNEEQEKLRAGIFKLAKGQLNEGLIERDREGEFNRAGWTACAEAGVHGLPIPVEYGGMGMDALTTVGVLESLGYGCKDNGLVFSINAHMWTAEMPLLGFGTEAQKKKWLPGLCSGALIGGNAMTEPASGSDAYSMTTLAEKKGDHYKLNGNKLFVSNGSVADMLVVYATVEKGKGASGVSAFIVEKGMKGFTVSREVDKMGTRTSPMGELFFDDCEIPLENRLGNEGDGVMMFTHSMTWERACILASAVGSMQRLLDTSIKYARTRKQFGQSIGKFQSIANKIVDMKLRVESARSMLYKTAWLRTKGKSIFMEAAMTKLLIAENWVQCAQDAMQIHGGYGYMPEYEIERELRDAFGSRIYSGTSEIQRVLIASLLGL